MDTAQLSFGVWATGGYASPGGRPSEPTGELSGVVKASFAGGKLHLEYLDRRGCTQWLGAPDVR